MLRTLCNILVYIELKINVSICACVCNIYHYWYEVFYWYAFLQSSPCMILIFLLSFTSSSRCWLSIRQFLWHPFYVLAFFVCVQTKVVHSKSMLQKNPSPFALVIMCYLLFLSDFGSSRKWVSTICAVGINTFWQLLTQGFDTFIKIRTYVWRVAISVLIIWFCLSSIPQTYDTGKCI